MGNRLGSNLTGSVSQIDDYSARRGSDSARFMSGIEPFYASRDIGAPKTSVVAGLNVIESCGDVCIHFIYLNDE
jgi:hypothetical protein